MTALRVEGLVKSFGRHDVLNGADLALTDGEFTAVLGPSGCGKTTLLRIIAGFEHAAAGTVTIGDLVVDDGAGGHVPPGRRRVGYVAQEGGLFPHLNVAANVGFALRRGRERAARVEELLEFVGLAGLGSRRPDELSGGQQQRVALARALAPRPQLVLLDEPFASLDATLRVSLRNDVTRVLRSAGATVVLVTHDQDEALSLGDKVAVMRNGRIVQIGRPTDVYARPVDPETAAFLGDANLLPGRAAAGTAICNLGHLTLSAAPPADGEITVLVRPEQFQLTTAGNGTDAAKNVTGNATVVGSEYHGHDALTEVVLDGHPGDPLVARVRGVDVTAPGTRVTLAVTGSVHSWPAPPAVLPVSAEPEVVDAQNLPDADSIDTCSGTGDGDRALAALPSLAETNQTR